MNGLEQEEHSGFAVPSKLRQVLQSRKVWAGVIGLVTTLSLWGLGEIDGPRAIEAIGWVLGIFIGSVALEDGMTRLFGTLAHAVATYDAQEAVPNDGTNETRKLIVDAGDATEI